MSKFLKILLYVLLGLSALVIVGFYVQSSSFNFGLSNMSAIMSNITMVDGIIWWTYLLLGVSIITLICLSVYTMINNAKSLKKTGIILGITVVLVLVSYLLASGSPVEVNVAEAPTPQTLKMTDTGLILTYILFGASIVLLIGGGIYNAIKNR